MNDTQQQEQIQNELTERVQNFNAELIELLKKYELGLGAVPFISPDGRILARPQLVNDQKKDKEVEPTDLAQA